MEYQNTIALYEDVAELTKQMLSAARQQDWDKLTELETSCAQHVVHLKMIKEALPLAKDGRERKVASIKSILEDDREIRNLVSPWMARLNLLINSYNNTGGKVTRAYGQ
ncbi:MAG: flagellar protein FliT [Betaproteobacteria bacterium]